MTSVIHEVGVHGAHKTPTGVTGATGRVRERRSTLSPAGFVLDERSVIDLQRMVGNRAVSRLIKPRVVQRLDFNRTRWDDVTSANISTGGGLGVLIANDGNSPLIVKAGEDFVVEATVAANLLNQATEEGGGGGGSFTARAPQARSVDAAEAAAIHQKVDPMVRNTDRGQRFLIELGANRGVMVYGFFKGRDMAAELTRSQTRKTGLLGSGRRQLDRQSLAYKMTTDPSIMRMLGRAAAADILLGNRDRLSGAANLENMMVNLETSSIGLIDNVNAGPRALLRDMNMPGQGPQRAEAGFLAWATSGDVPDLAGNAFAAISNRIVDELEEVIIGGALAPGLAMKPADLPFVTQAFTENKTRMKQWMALGLIAGKSAVLGSMSAVTALTSGVDYQQREAATTALLARRYFLQRAGTSPEDAWHIAQNTADVMFGRLRA